MLYALQTASNNLRHVRFQPMDAHEIVINPRDARDTPLFVRDQWCDEDYLTEEEVAESVPKERLVELNGRKIRQPADLQELVLYRLGLDYTESDEKPVSTKKASVSEMGACATAHENAG